MLSMVARAVSAYMANPHIFEELKKETTVNEFTVEELVKEEVKNELIMIEEGSKSETKEEVKLETTEKVEEPTKEEVKVEKVNDDKENIKVKVITEEKISPVIRVNPKEEKTPEIKVKINEDDKITMTDRKVSPVIKIKAKEEEKPKIKVKTKDEKKESTTKTKVVKEQHDEEQHRLLHLIEYLKNSGVVHSMPQKMPTGLYELYITQSSGMNVLISVDINGLLYDDAIKFYIGRIMPGEEYMKPVIMMTNESVKCIKENKPVPKKYFISESLFVLNKVLNMQTLKEKDAKKRAKVFEVVGKILTDEELYAKIIEASGKEPFRFAVARYKNENEFSLVSSKKNLSSNLSDDRLVVSKEIWINYKDKKVDLIIKKSAK